MTELFLRGDPRFLSGGAPTTSSVDYEFDPDYVESFGDAVVSATLNSNETLANAIKSKGQQLHTGRSSYHHRPPLNIFLSRDDPHPSVGVELETVLKIHAARDYDKVTNALISNWFHFETDSSIGDDGWECITEPLPSRVYHDQRTWLGLQNILAQWAGSWDSSCTGLHVHVGLDGFRQPDAIPFPLPEHNVRILGKTLIAYVYFVLTDPAFNDAVFMRPNSHFCGAGEGKASIVRAVFPAQDSGTSPTDITRIAFSRLFMSSENNLEIPQKFTYDPCELADGAIDRIYRAWGMKDYMRSYQPPFNLSGHEVELNLTHNHTAEFRRGKGTLNGLTVHRMVDYVTLIVRYAIEIMNPTPARDFLPSHRDFYAYVAGNAVSASLREMAEKEKEKKCA